MQVVLVNDNTPLAAFAARLAQGCPPKLRRWVLQGPRKRLVNLGWRSTGYPPGAAPDLASTRSGASPRAGLPCSFWERPGTLDFLAPRVNYSSCRDVVQLYSVRHSGDMARICDTAPVICRGFVIFEVRHAKRPQQRAPLRRCLPP